MTIAFTTTEKTWIERLVLVGVIAFTLFEWHASRVALSDMKTSIAKIESARASASQATNIAVQAVLKAAKDAKNPAQKVDTISKLAALPTPITLEPIAPGALTPPAAIVPASDIQPLLTFTAECVTCKLKLANDDQQIKQLTQERDIAVKTAKGGSFWQRTRKIAKYVGIGIVVGVAAGAAAKR
jgi:hypothetical protein